MLQVDSPIYSLISTSDTYREVLGNYRKCKFCRKKDSETNFNNTPHIIPELLGSNNFTYSSECDTCNSIFSKYESHLAVFFRPYLTLNNIKGKNKVPEFRSRQDDRTSTTGISTIEGNIEMDFETNRDDFKLGLQNKTITVKFRKTPFKPRSVYKAIARIGISLLPNSELSKYDHVCKWLLNDNEDSINLYPIVFLTMLNTGKIETPFAKLYKANKLIIDDHEVPDLFLIVGFANLIVQLFIPYSSEFDRIHNSNRKLKISLLSVLNLDNSRNKEWRINLSRNESIKHDDEIIFEYKDIESSFFS